MKLKTKRSKGGFTLIEIIIAVVVLAIVAAMMASYLGKSFPSLTRSSVPIANLNKSLSLNQVMEKISVQYAMYPHWRASTNYPQGTIILSPTLSGGKGFQYVSGGGTSGATQPASWQTATGGIPTPTDSSITWTLSSTCAPPLLSNSCQTNGGCTFTCPTDLQSLIGAEGQNYTNAFGSYQVINNHFITLATNTEQPCTSITTCPVDYPRYLKVTIGFRSDNPAGTGETLTTLFVLR